MDSAEAPIHEEKLRKYVDILASYEGKIRLTGPTDPEVLWRDHVQDCLFSVHYLPSRGKILDVGSGGGLPGIIWALSRPDLEVTLLDSVRKKCRALEEIAQALDLNNVRVIWSRCEDFARKEREAFALAGARAVAETGVLLEYLSPLVSPGGTVMAMKGPLYEEEIAPLMGKWDHLGLSMPTIIPDVGSEKKKFLILWGKESPCPARFPRKVGMAEKSHWWRG